MDNVTVNESSQDNLAATIGTAAADGVLLVILFIVSVMSIFLLAALLALKSELVRSIRVILINILVAGVVGELGSAVYHITALVVLSKDNLAFLKPVCHIVTFLDLASSSGRVLFAAYYALTVFIVVRWWNKPVLAPRNTKYFIIGAVFLWILAILVYIPAIIYEDSSKFCASISRDSLNTNALLTLYATLPYFFVSSIPIIVTPIVLIIISCYIKSNTIGDNRDAKKALVKFGFFLLIIQGFNAIAQIVSPLLLLIGISLKDGSLSTTVTVTTAISDLSRIPTNVLVIIFFKPVQDKLKKWICCCCLAANFRQRQAMSTQTHI